MISKKVREINLERDIEKLRGRIAADLNEKLAREDLEDQMNRAYQMMKIREDCSTFNLEGDDRLTRPIHQALARYANFLVPELNLQLQRSEFAGYDRALHSSLSVSFREYAQLEVIKSIAPAASLLETSMQIYNFKSIHAPIKHSQIPYDPSLLYLSRIKTHQTLPLMNKI